MKVLPLMLPLLLATSTGAPEYRQIVDTVRDMLNAGQPIH